MGSRKTSENGKRAPFVQIPNGKDVERILSGVFWADVAGFSLCQTWNILCVALPDPITYASPFLDLRWVSLATSLCGTMVAALFRHRVSALLQRPTFLYAIGAVAALGSILGPLSALYPPTSKALIYIAAVCVGVGFAFLFLLWFERFCRARDMMGLAISVVATALLTYPLANMLSSDQVSPWIAAAIASVLPLVSVALAHARPRQGNPADPSPAPAASIPPAGRRRAFVRYCVCVFAIVSVIETARNLLLGGTALVFYAGVANLGGLALKLAFSAWLLVIFDAHSARGVSVVYRTAFILLLGVVLCIPYLLEGAWFVHALLDISAFFFQLIMVLVAYEISVGFSLHPLLVFGATRSLWAAAALSGIVLSGACRTWGAEVVQMLAVLLGLAVAVAFTFVFTDRDCIVALSSLPAPTPTPRFKIKCEQLARHHGVSERELEVMMLTAKGRSANRIADDLGVTLATVNSHVHHIYQKLGVHQQQELIEMVERLRLQEDDPR